MSDAWAVDQQRLSNLASFQESVKAKRAKAPKRKRFVPEPWQYSIALKVVDAEIAAKGQAA